MKITDKVALSILSCLLGLFLIVGSVCGILSVTVCNSDFMLKVFNSRVDYSSIYAEYCEEQEYLAIPAGVGEGVLSSVVQQPEFESIINLMVEKAYADDGVSLVTEFDSLCLTERFYQAMYQYFSVEKGYDITEEMSNDMYYVAGIANDNCFDLVRYVLLASRVALLGPSVFPFLVVELLSCCLLSSDLFVTHLGLPSKEYQNTHPWLYQSPLG